MAIFGLLSQTDVITGVTQGAYMVDYYQRVN
jgi:hypothetical protein